MATFEYSALTSGGEKRKGVIQGDSARQARQVLRDGGLTVIDCQEIRRSAGVSQRTPLLGVGAGEVSMFTRLLATLTRSGLPIDDALLALAEQTESRAMKRVIHGVRGRVLEGHSLAQGFEGYARIFPPLFTATVAAGEQTRHLPLVLERLADYLEEQELLSGKLRLAFIYPGVLVTTAILVVGGLLTYVVPQIVKVFVNIGQELPLLTRLLMAASDFALAWGGLMALATLVLVVLLRYIFARPGPRLWLDARILALPLIGRLNRASNAARLTRTLSILLESGVPLVEALRIAARAVGNSVVRNAISDAAVRVQEGTALHRALGMSKRFPPLTLHLIASGEAGGKLETMLDTAAKAHEREVQGFVATFLAIIEPALILAMGVIVLLIVIAILLPIFELNEMV